MAWQVLTSPEFDEYDTSGLTGVNYGGNQRSQGFLIPTPCAPSAEPGVHRVWAPLRQHPI